MTTATIPEGYRLREARPDEASALKTFLLAHGPNPWNYLPEDGVAEHFVDLAARRIGALVVERAGEVAGFVTYLPTLPPDHPARAFDQVDGPAAYVAEAVVHRDHAGKGLGAALLEAVRDRLISLGAGRIYVERHEENAASAGMMRKAGFGEVATFNDPARRASGSRRTTLCRYPAP